LETGNIILVLYLKGGQTLEGAVAPAEHSMGDLTPNLYVVIWNSTPKRNTIKTVELWNYRLFGTATIRVPFIQIVVNCHFYGIKHILVSSSESSGYRIVHCFLSRNNLIPTAMCNLIG
jgi:hypothetical protein